MNWLAIWKFLRSGLGKLALAFVAGAAVALKIMRLFRGSRRRGGPGPVEARRTDAGRAAAARAVEALRGGADAEDIAAEGDDFWAKRGKRK